MNWLEKKEAKIIEWTLRVLKVKVERVDLVLLGIGILIFLLEWHCFNTNGSRLFTAYAVFVGWMLFLRRFDLADKQLGISTRKEALERYVESAKFLSDKNLTLQLAGVRGLELLLEESSKEGSWIAKEAKISLETFLHENWFRKPPIIPWRVRNETPRSLRLAEKPQNYSLRIKIRDAAIKVLLRTCEKGEKALDFSSLDLKEAELADASLVGVKFHKTNLSYARFHRANLSGAEFNGATLHGTQFPGALLRNTDLSKANLEEANFCGAKLRGARFEDADLSKAELIGVDFDDVDLSGADLSGANLSQAQFKGVKGLDKLKSFKGIYSTSKSMEPFGLPDEFLKELRNNPREMTDE